MKLGGAGLISFRRLIRACKTETLRLTDRYQQLCSQTPRRPAVPLEGCQDPAAHPCPWHGHCCEPAVDLLRSAFGPEKVSVHTLDPKLGPRPNSPLSTLPSCHLQLPRLATERLPGHGRGAGCPSEPRHSPRPLGGNHKNKAGASFVPRGMFSPCFCFMKLFGL